jgi:hypothetical protein
MKALEPRVLQSALRIQDELLGPTIDFDPRRPAEEIDVNSLPENLTVDMRDRLHVINGLNSSSWFFHSPLQYWSCSSERIAEDEDIITTVNKGSKLATSVNVTLRHSIVFSGKQFEDHKLVAADALVITLVHMLDSPVGRQWERNAQEIGRRKSNNWRLYPSDGRSLASTLYEFRFQPLSLPDDLFLGIAYSLTSIYFFFSLSKLRALKSRLGLILAVVCQIAVSIMSSFTVCAIFKIDLSKIPREAYPLVILTVGLENIFRLINAVIMTPPQASTTSRMTEAIGRTGHVALAGVTQNLMILGLLTKVVSPGVSAFCNFAAIALTFDFFYLLTFFLAVLSIDVRRTELSDSLNRASLRQRPSSPESQLKQTWLDAIVRGEAPVSTRLAGTVVMISFVIVAQWHFFDNESLFQTAFRVLNWTSQNPPQKPISLLSIDVNQARTPTAWLKMQDHETAHEVIQVVKPNAHSYIARVYDPLIFVLDGSDRSSNHFGVRRFSPAFYDFIKKQIPPFIITVILVVSAVSLLMNYLLWNESPEDDVSDRPDDNPLLSVKSLSNGHALDVIYLATSTDGIIASVGLDRRIQIWNVRRGGGGYAVHDPDSDIDPFPVLAMAIDNVSNWLAILSSKNIVFLWNIPERRWGPSIEVSTKGKAPGAFFFVDSGTTLIGALVLVRNDGILIELHPDSGDRTETRICRTPLVCIRQYVDVSISTNSTTPEVRIITASRRGCVHIATRTPTGWASEEVPCESETTQIVSLLPLPILKSILVIRDRSVELVDITTNCVTHTFQTKSIKINSVRCFHSARRRPQCGSTGLAYFGLAYTSAETGQCILQVYLPPHEGDTICFRDPCTPGSKTCCLWRETMAHVHTIDNPGDWEALSAGYLVGIRKYHENMHSIDEGHEQSSRESGLRRRGGLDLQERYRTKKDDDDDKWEVWSISSRGEQTTAPLSNNQGSSDRDHLLVGSLGPLAILGKRSLVVGVGDLVKVISLGNERFDGLDSESEPGTFTGVASNRRKKANNLQKRRFH